VVKKILLTTTNHNIGVILAIHCVVLEYLDANILSYSIARERESYILNKMQLNSVTS